MAGHQPPLSLKARALALLAQREHSASELRRKLLRHARERLAPAAGAADPADAPRPAPAASAQMRSAGQPASEDQHEFHLHDLSRQGARRGEPVHPHADDPGNDALARVDAVIDWLRAHRYLSEERFVESRVHARASRYGNLRIRQELAQHGLQLSADAAQALRDSELARAAKVWQRKFGQAPTDAAEKARQSRFLAQRGFSAETVARVLRDAATAVPDADDLLDG